MDNNAGMPTFKKCYIPLTISFSSILITLYLIQAALYFFSPQRALPLNGLSGGIRYTWGHKVKNNRFNFRERNFDVPKPPNTYRIMVLGDSLTWGTGLSESQRYSNILEKMLSSKIGGQLKFEVLNFGLEGLSTIKERDIAYNFFKKVEPDLILVGFCLNDPQPRSQIWSRELHELKQTMKFHLFSFFLNVLKSIYLSNVAELMEKSFFNFAERIKVIPNWVNSLGRTYLQESIEWKNFVSALNDIKKLSDSKELPPPIFAVLNQALDKGIAADYRHIKEHVFSKWYEQAAKAAIGAGFKVIDFKNEIASLPLYSKLIINDVDGHPSSILNKVYAKKMFVNIKPIIINYMHR